MATQPKKLVAWIAPEQEILLKNVVKATKMKLVAIGASDQTATTAIAQHASIDQCNDLRTMITQFDDAVLWIAESGAYDVSLCELLRHRSMPTVTTTPLSGNMDDLVKEAGIQPAAKFVPLMGRSTGFGEVQDDTEQFGSPITAHCTMLCSNVEGTLWARLFDAMDFIVRLFGTPDSVHAFFHGGKVPDEPSDLRGHMSVNLQFQQQRCATLLLSDQATWKREALIISKDHTTVITDGGETPASMIANGISSTLTDPTPAATADAPRVLALCEAARMSCLTGSSEQPNRVLEMLQ